ncbi:hypothetical protein NDU88_006015 [Pleurodeles waltl]|uniref:Uncharacterized protein n=1 Tax=Pleurodeles waltl TaxID=8319 RepID=A0AAV7LQQ9_PLEWA|nr:hypothetical protein NDU88_006015 [Pleurodeles waltl]
MVYQTCYRETWDYQLQTQKEGESHKRYTGSSGDVGVEEEGKRGEGAEEVRRSAGTKPDYRFTGLHSKASFMGAFEAGVEEMSKSKGVASMRTSAARCGWASSSSVPYGLAEVVDWRPCGRPASSKLNPLKDDARLLSDA